jgi:streptomycin 6-kinase
MLLITDLKPGDLIQLKRGMPAWQVVAIHGDTIDLERADGSRSETQTQHAFARSRWHRVPVKGKR